MTGFDFDRPIERSGTGSEKWDGRLARFGRADVVPLWVADMDFAAPPEVVQALMQRAAHPVYGYTQVGEDAFIALRAWLRERFAWPVERDMLMLAPGVVPSIHAAILACSAPGEGIIVQPPVYAPFMGAVRQLGRRVLENPLQPVVTADGVDYAIDLAGLERCAADGARMLLLCSPHNPVGRVWREDELRAVLDIARRHGLVVFSDEIHADLVYAGHRHVPLATLATDADQVLTAVAPSKTFNVPGLGLSALVIAHAPMRAAVQRVFDDWHWQAGNPFSLVAFVAAYRHGASWLEALLETLRANRNQAADDIRRHWSGVQPVLPQGTALMWLDCRALGLDDVALQHFFVERCGLGLSPGIQFGAAGSGFMRLNFGTQPARLQAAISQAAPAFRRSGSGRHGLARASDQPDAG